MPKIAVAQTECIIGDVSANLAIGSELIRDAGSQGASLVILPECFTTGLCGDNAQLAESVPGPSTEKLGEAARAAESFVVFGMVEENPSGMPFNAAILLGPDGEVRDVYRKVHLYLGETQGFSAGSRRCVADLGFCRAAITICYDYIFPEYIRGLVDAGASLLIHPTAWVNTDECESWNYNTHAYRAVAIARAIENTVFLATANHTSAYDDGGHLRALGESAIIAPWGEILAEVPEGQGIAVAECEFDKIEGWQNAAAPYLRDRKRTFYFHTNLVDE